MSALRTLLHNLIDYAGLFPPASLDMPAAVQAYSAYRAGPEAWALGRFVVPVSRLGEFEAATAGLLPTGTEDPWRLSVLAGPDLHADVSQIIVFNERHAPGSDLGECQIDAIELKVQRKDEIEAAMRLLPAVLMPFFELTLQPALHDLIACLATRGGRAKVRTGGSTADAFPAPAELCDFVASCVAAGVPFKATAGLHHPLRAVHKLTYQPDSPTGDMFGFLNVFLTAALLVGGVQPAAACELLTETQPHTLRFNDRGVEWRGHTIDSATLAATRRSAALSFGSCSFREPIDDLKAMGLL